MRSRPHPRTETAAPPRVGILSLLRPAPLAFIAFFFSYALQVLFHSELLGLLPFLLFFPGIVLYVLRILGPKRSSRSGTRAPDLAVGLLALFVIGHLIVGISVGGYTFPEAVRLFLIYVGTAWAYLYASRIAREHDLRVVTLAIAVAGTIFAVYWMHETYTKMIRKEIPTFQLMSFEYKKMRNDMTNEEMNTSTLGTQYRANGLSGTYTTTGALVAISGFAALSLLGRGTTRRRVLILSVFFVVLAVGLAATALVTYLILCPIVLWLAAREEKWLQSVLRMMSYAAVAFGLIFMATLYTHPGRELIRNSTDMLRKQISVVRNTNSSYYGIPSLYESYQRAFYYYGLFAREKPIGLFVGEGPLGYGEVTFGRGGDFGMLDLAALCGIPFSIFFLGICMIMLIRAAETCRRGSLREDRALHVVFGFAVVAFGLISLLHYGVLLNKEVIVLFYFALGLLRRYTYAPLTQQVRAVHVAATAPGAPSSVLAHAPTS